LPGVSRTAVRAPHGFPREAPRRGVHFPPENPHAFTFNPNDPERAVLRPSSPTSVRRPDKLIEFTGPFSSAPREGAARGGCFTTSEHFSFFSVLRRPRPAGSFAGVGVAAGVVVTRESQAVGADRSKKLKDRRFAPALLFPRAGPQTRPRPPCPPARSALGQPANGLNEFEPRSRPNRRARFTERPAPGPGSRGRKRLALEFFLRAAKTVAPRKTPKVEAPRASPRRSPPFLRAESNGRSIRLGNKGSPWKDTPHRSPGGNVPLLHRRPACFAEPDAGKGRPRSARRQSWNSGRSARVPPASNVTPFYCAQVPRAPTVPGIGPRRPPVVRSRTPLPWIRLPGARNIGPASS